MKSLVIIPARGGSKGIANKNIATVAGRPLIEWTIAAALAAKSVDRVVVSTDADQIADVARRCGAEVPFLRPADLATDETPGIPPLLHAVHWLAEHEKYYPDFVMCLQPTSPLRTEDDIDAAVELIRTKNGDSVVSVTRAEIHPYWTKRVDDDGRLCEWLAVGPPVLIRQHLPPVYALNGAIYVARRDVLLARRSWYTDRSYAYVMPAARALDIDTEWHLHLADLILRDKLANERHRD